MLSNLLFYRFMVTNVLLFCLAGALWLEGYVQPVIEGGAPLTYAILALFVIGWLWCLKEVLVVSSELNRNKQIGAAPAIEAQREKDVAKTEWLGSVAEWLVGLGLLGTVIGFMVALEAVDTVSIGSADGAKVGVGKLMTGMRVALTTTLLGASLGMWQELNVRLLRTGLTIYWSNRMAADNGMGKIRGQD